MVLHIIIGLAAGVLVVCGLLWIVLRYTSARKNAQVRFSWLTQEEIDLPERERNRLLRDIRYDGRILKRFRAASRNIFSTYQKLDNIVSKKRSVPASAEWLLDNYYLIEEQTIFIRNNLSKKALSRLPIVKDGGDKGRTRVFVMAERLLRSIEHTLDEKTVVDYLTEYQKKEVLFERELWMFPFALKVALIAAISRYCNVIMDTTHHIERADNLFEKWAREKDEITAEMKALFMFNLNTKEKADSSFVEHLLYRFHRSNKKHSEIFKVVEEGLSQYGWSAEKTAQHEHNRQSVYTMRMGNTMTSLNFLGAMDWAEIVGDVSAVSGILMQDPTRTYEQMDTPSQNCYRQKVEEYAGELHIAETVVARRAVELAKKADETTPLARKGNHYSARLAHVGRYLIDDGVDELKKSCGAHSGLSGDKRKLYILRGISYFGAMCLIMGAVVSAVAIYAYNAASAFPWLFAMLAALFMLIPASEMATMLINKICSAAVRPKVLMRLKLKEGVPKQLSTVVVVPVVFSNEKRVKEILENIEQHHLSTREENVFFAVVASCGDAKEEHMPADAGIIDKALSGIEALNEKYGGGKHDRFYMFFRPRIYNKKNKVWTAWERKRGALLEFNELVLNGAKAGFSAMSHSHPPFGNIKYVITLDSDTILPIGMAKKFIGTMAHPLNRPVVDPKKNIVVKGYGIMQPRVEIESESAEKSVFSKLFTGQDGIDPYSGAVSNVYQDLFEEGIYTGKGIYDVEIFQMLLKDALPEDAILSHDLIEGAVVRTALVTDMVLVDSYPSKVNSYMSRLHRWVRGDWQLLPAMFSSRKRKGRRITALSVWKMLDNLKRSLFVPSMLIFLLLGYIVFPGHLAFWLGCFALMLTLPFWISCVSRLILACKGRRTKRHMPVFTGISAAFFQMIFQLIVMPYQAFMMLHAVILTLIRLITKNNLLEWETADDVEKRQKNTLSSYIMRVLPSWLFLVVAYGLIAIFSPLTYVYAFIPFFVLWTISPALIYLYSKHKNPPITASKLCSREAESKQCSDDCLRITARKTWRYFEEFASAKNNYLAPDNFQEEPYTGVASRTSPTNIGLGLLASLAACDFGYISIEQFLSRTDKTVSVIEKLKKWNGHLYNWYETDTLKCMNPRYISTVDSGNYVGYLIAVRQGLAEFKHRQRVDTAFFGGLRDTLYAAGEDGKAAYDEIVNLLPAYERKKLMCEKCIDLSSWKNIFDAFSLYNYSHLTSNSWKNLISCMLSVKGEPQYRYLNDISALLRKLSGLVGYPDGYYFMLDKLTDILSECVTVGGFDDNITRAAAHIDNMVSELDGGEHSMAIKQLFDIKKRMLGEKQRNDGIIARANSLARRIDALTSAVKFAPLYDEKRKLFSIGYDEKEQSLTNSYYDLFASEARQASYIAVARNEVDIEHWAKLKRVMTVKDGYKGLLSWTGTMFEYLMPNLLMKNYKNTLLDETYSFAVRSQKKYGKEKDTPWGASECGFNVLDKHSQYQYKAIGVPWLGLKRGLAQDSVITPYASFLALGISGKAALKNIKRLQQQGLDGPYGFYEAADYTPERRLYDKNHSIVKSYMAHHQGMILLSIDNYLHDNIMQQRFHADAEINAARLLLQERVPSSLVLRDYKRKRLVTHREQSGSSYAPIREVKGIRDMPIAHVLTNGKYSVLITDRGTGYSRNNGTAISRWRVQSPQPYGMFFYLRDLSSNRVWSAAYAPLNQEAYKYKAELRLEKAIFKRTDKDFITKTEVIVASGDNAEIRRITVKNLTGRTHSVEITGYFETVISDQAADVAHPAFSNLFVETTYLPDKKCLISRRRARKEDEKPLLAGFMLVSDGKGEPSGVQFESDRMHFLGRAKSSVNVDIAAGKPLTGTVGAVLDPVSCLRANLTLPAGRERSLSFVVVTSRNEDALLALVDKYAQPETLNTAFGESNARSIIERGYTNLTNSQIHMYQDILSHIAFGSSTRLHYKEIIERNRLGQSALWQFGISGDYPITLFVMNDTKQADFLYDILKMHEYFRLHDIKTDLIILSEEKSNYFLPLHDFIADAVDSGQFNDKLNYRGNVFILDACNLSDDTVSLLYAASRLILRGDGGGIDEQVNMAIKQYYPKDMKFPLKARGGESEPPDDKGELYENGIGGFSADGSEYIIRLRKGQNTPTPWSNVVANMDYGFLATELGGGYTFKSNSRQYKITPWSNDMVTDPPGEVIYVRDDQTGELFTPTVLPLRDDNTYVIRHGYGYTQYLHNSNGTQQSLMQFVPLTGSVKINSFKLKNVTGERRAFTVCYFIQPVLGVDGSTTAMHIVARMSGGVIKLTNKYNDEFPNETCFVAASEKIDSYTSDGVEFFGGGDLTAPAALRRESLTGSCGTGLYPVVAVNVRVDLRPSEEKEIIFLLGAHSDDSAIHKMCAKYCGPKTAETELNTVKKFWKEKCGLVTANTPSASFNILASGRLTYQTMACRLWARTGFYQSGGAFGFRDQLQDVLSLAATSPYQAKKQILLHAGKQFAEGDVLHWWHEPSGMGIRTRISDDLLWLPYVTAEYVRISGDEGIWNEVIKFIDGDALEDDESEKYIKPMISVKEGSLYEHCIRAISRSLGVGAHGLPLMGTGDWNDGMNAVGHKGKGESVWLGWFLVSILDMFVPVCAARGDNERADEYKGARDRLVDAIETEGWDGRWYKRAYFDNGKPLGSIVNKECIIDSIAQSWAVMSGAADEKRARMAISSAENYLLKKEEGYFALFTPPMDKMPLNAGYIKGYLPGVRENGGQYTHAAAWMVIALAMLGEGNKAYELYELLNPIEHTENYRECLRYKAEPYVMAADVYAVYPHQGRGGWTWYTGSAGWMQRAATEYILGVVKNGDKLTINPCIPDSWEGFTLRFNHNFTIYNITVQNPDRVQRGVVSVTVDGGAVEGNTFKLARDERSHNVLVVMGQAAKGETYEV